MAHHCWYLNYKDMEDRLHSGRHGIFSSKTAINPALLSALLLLMMIIGAIVIASKM